MVIHFFIQGWGCNPGLHRTPFLSSSSSAVMELSSPNSCSHHPPPHVPPPPAASCDCGPLSREHPELEKWHSGQLSAREALGIFLFIMQCLCYFQMPQTFLSLAQFSETRSHCTYMHLEPLHQPFFEKGFLR
jgi:hypothetical protein